MDQHLGILQDMLGSGHPRKTKHKRSRARSYKDLQPSEEPTASPLALEKSTALAMAGVDSGFTDVPSLAALEGGQIRAFAKLEFDDGPFYMNTYSVELGRDVRAAKAAVKDDLKTRERSKGKNKKRSSSLAPQATPQAKRDGSGIIHRSVVSESGGVMALDLPDEENDGCRWRKSKSRKRSKISRSTSSSSRAVSRKNSSSRSTFDPRSQSFPATVVSHRASYSHPVNPFSLLPSPDECPLIPIHPPAVAAETGGHRGISRKHVRIAFNFDKHLFELQIKGKNGAFVDDRWHASGETLPLRSGTHIQIGGVSLRFVLPDVVADEAVVDEEIIEEQQAEEGMNMTDDDSSDDSSDDENDSSQEEEVVWSEEDEEVESKSSDGDEVKGGKVKDEVEPEEEGVKDQVVEPSPSPLPVPKRRGPGRPPKNGKMSIQKQKEAQRLAQKEKIAKEKDSPPPMIPKRKVGRPRKHPLPDSGSSKQEKKKKVKNDEVETTAEPNEARKRPSTEGKEGREVTKEKKEKKPPKPPRSPSPVFNEAELTPEQLQKPQASYVVLIHEALSNSKSGPMSLPQIYRAIERRYPYFKLRVTTNGWQSSVRHNLSQCEAFKKVQRDGKGWMWGLVEGMSIQKERKRKTSTGGPEKPSARLNSDQSTLPVSASRDESLPSGYNLPEHHPSSGGGNQSPGYLPNQGHNQRTTPHPHPIGGKTRFPSYPPPQFPNHHYPQLPFTTQSRVYQSPYAPLPSTSQHNLNPSNANHPNPSIQQQQPHPTPQAPAPSSSAPSQPTIPQSGSKGQNQQPPNNLLSAISNFKSALINSLAGKSTNNVINASNREQIVQSAINRALGLSTKSSVTIAPSSTTNGNADAEVMAQIEKHEKMIIKGVKTLIKSFTGSGNNKHGPSGGESAGGSGTLERSSSVSGTIAVAGPGETGQAETRKRPFEEVDAARERSGVEGGDTTTGQTEMNKRAKLDSE